MKQVLIAAVACVAFASGAWAGEPVATLALGANGVWFQGDRHYPANFELGANGSASLSPHISAVAALYFGLDDSYLRGSFGGRVTVTEVDDNNLSIGVGIQYHAASEPDIRPDGEWAPDVSLAWKPSPINMPRVVLVGQASYGLESEQAWLTAGARYTLPIGGGR